MGEPVRNPSSQALAVGCSLGALRASFPEAVPEAPPSLWVKCPGSQSQGWLPSVSRRLKAATAGRLGLEPLGQVLPNLASAALSHLSGLDSPPSTAPRRLPLFFPLYSFASSAIEMQIVANCR